MIAALLFQLPADGIASQGAQPAAQNSSALVEMIQNSGPVAMAVLVLLLIASLYSWSVILGKMSTFRTATRQSQRFLRAFRKATRLQEMAGIAEDCKASPLAQVFEEVYETYKRQTGGSGPPRNLAPLERSAQTAASEAVTSLERRLTWLATIASASPFVGLFRHGHRHCGRLSRTGHGGSGHAAGCRAGHQRGTDYHGGRAVCGHSGSDCLQPVHGAHQGVCRSHRRLLPRVAEFVGGDSSARAGSCAAREH